MRVADIRKAIKAFAPGRDGFLELVARLLERGPLVVKGLGLVTLIDRKLTPEDDRGIWFVIAINEELPHWRFSGKIADEGGFVWDANAPTRVKHLKS